MNNSDIAELYYQFENLFLRLPNYRINPSKKEELIIQLAEQCKSTDKAMQVILILLANLDPFQLEKTLMLLKSEKLI
ncbi:hypothetical protein [Vibrio diazotrophicus]|uniref:hypothetical protein n=1 Tax=Vibrio diazotrophicus TaxID=685 RepID=UPI000C9DCD65|nr:hypothetical protein [Vibrio diazotrophicus]PNH95725.1 hypothetical protein C1O24_13400 [Vibrio diazotrophicus]